MKASVSSSSITVLLGFFLASPAVAGAQEEFLAVKNRAEALSQECAEASKELLSTMLPKPNLSAAKSAAEIVQAECGNIEVELWKVGRVNDAPLKTKYAVDMWLSRLRHLAFNRSAMGRKTKKYIETQEKIFFEHFNNLVGEDAALQKATQEFLSDAEAAVSLPVEKRRASALGPSKQRELDGFISRTQAITTRCDANSSKLDMAMEAPPNRQDAAAYARTVIAECAESERSLTKVTPPSGLPKSIVGWLDSWTDEMASAANKKVEAARAALNFANGGGPGDVEAFMQYKFGQWEKEIRASDHLMEARLDGGLKVGKSGTGL
jgi:hypothetical protein